MDLQAWKQSAKKRLEALAVELRTDAPEILYGALSEATELEMLAAGDSELRDSAGKLQGKWDPRAGALERFRRGD